MDSLCIDCCWPACGLSVQGPSTCLPEPLFFLSYRTVWEFEDELVSPGRYCGYCSRSSDLWTYIHGNIFLGELNVPNKPPEKTVSKLPVTCITTVWWWWSRDCAWVGGAYKTGTQRVRLRLRSCKHGASVRVSYCTFSVNYTSLHLHLLVYTVLGSIQLQLSHLISRF